MQATPRLVAVELSVVGSASASWRGLYSWLGGGGGSVEARLTVFRVSRLAVGLQVSCTSRGVRAARRFRVESTGAPVCKYHEPLRGGLGVLWYCCRPASGRLGFCREHSSTYQALFEACATGGDESACIRADLASPGEEYVVYILDDGGGRLKVGLTRAWRFHVRILEQPHGVAVVAGRFGSLVEAREAERRLASRVGFGEQVGRLEDRLARAARLLASLDTDGLAARAAAAAARAGLRGVVEATTVLPMGGVGGVGALASARSVEVGGGLEVSLVDYWGGFLLLGGGRRVRKGDLLHRRMLVSSVEWGWLGD